ncbi:hypothetical protein L3Q82_009153, partial [Scortum barcoo]
TMGVEGCTKCIKYMLFFFNFIFWLAGGVILGVALWLRHDPKTSNLLELEFDGAHAPSTFYIRPDLNNLLLGILMRFRKEVVAFTADIEQIVSDEGPCPAVAIFGLHQSVQCCETDFDPDVEQFVTRDFYVDDGLKFFPTVEMGVTLLQKTRDIQT